MRFVKNYSTRKLIGLFVCCLLGCSCGHYRIHNIQSYNPWFTTYEDLKLGIIKPQQEWYFRSPAYKGIDVTFNKKITIHRPRLRLAYYIIPHAVKYKNEECFYYGGVTLGEHTLEKAFFRGVPLCAFTNGADVYMLTLSPFIFIENKELDRSTSVLYLLKLVKNKGFTQMNYLRVNESSFKMRFPLQLEAISVLERMSFEKNYQNALVFQEVLRMYNAVLEDIQRSIEDKKRWKNDAHMMDLWRRYYPEIEKLNYAEIQRNALVYISQTMKNRPEILCPDEQELSTYLRKTPRGVKYKSELENINNLIQKIYDYSYLSIHEKNRYKKTRWNN